MKAPELKERLEESEKLIQEMTITWEEKLRKTEEVAQVGHISGLKIVKIDSPLFFSFFFGHHLYIESYTVFVSVCS